MSKSFGTQNTSLVFSEDSATGEISPNKSTNGAAHFADSIVPSSYTGNKSATTTVTGQSVAVATGATRIRVRNLDATNYGLVAFGTSASDAEANAANGVAIEAGAVEYIRVPSNATYISYLGDTGTVILNITQGN